MATSVPLSHGPWLALKGASTPSSWRRMLTRARVRQAHTTEGLGGNPGTPLTRAFGPLQRPPAQLHLEQRSVVAAVSTGRDAAEVFAADERGELPYRIINGKKFYMDEIDIAGILDGQSYLRPINRETYNAGAYLWKKIEDIDLERRVRLLDLLQPRHLTEMWQVAQENVGGAWMLERGLSGSEDEEEDEEDAPVYVSANDMLPAGGRDEPLKTQLWEGLVCDVPGLGTSKFQKTFFVGKDGRTYGRVILKEPLKGLGDFLTPLYFRVEEASEVVATDDSAEVSFDYMDGQLQLNEPGCLPKGLPRAKPHPPKFNDEMRDYLVAAGPDVLVGQTWQEGRELQSIPRKFLGEFILVRVA